MPQAGSAWSTGGVVPLVIRYSRLEAKVQGLLNCLDLERCAFQLETRVPFWRMVSDVSPLRGSRSRLISPPLVPQVPVSAGREGIFLPETVNGSNLGIHLAFGGRVLYTRSLAFSTSLFYHTASAPSLLYPRGRDRCRGSDAARHSTHRSGLWISANLSPPKSSSAGAP
jgi:hypothetical protein